MLPLHRAEITEDTWRYVRTSLEMVALEVPRGLINKRYLVRIHDGTPRPLRVGKMSAMDASKTNSRDSDGVFLTATSPAGLDVLGRGRKYFNLFSEETKRR